MTTWWTDEKCRELAAGCKSGVQDAACEILRLREENKKLRAVVDAAHAMRSHMGDYDSRSYCQEFDKIVATVSSSQDPS